MTKRPKLAQNLTLIMGSCHRSLSTVASGVVFTMAFVWLIFSNLALAIEVPDLYQASVTINNQSRQTQKIAQRDAFAKVLVKVSGNASVLDNPEVKEAVKKAAEYLRQYRFSRDDDNEMQLVASFDEAKINRLLRQESLPIWGKRRPSILLWMAGEDFNTATRHVISKESYAHVMAQTLKVSKDRGLPIVFPLYDIEDNKKVSVSDVWGHFYQHIRSFSLRYQTDAIVISRFWYEADPQEPDGDTDDNNEGASEGEVASDTNRDKNWKLEWRLYETDGLVEVKTIEGELNQVLEQLVHNMADKYAAEYAVDSSNLENATSMVMTIRNLSQLEYLIRAEKLLLSFSAVADVQLKSVNQDVAEFEIKLVGAPLDLLQGMDLEQQFEKIYDALADVDLKQKVEYKWVP